MRGEPTITAEDIRRSRFDIALRGYDQRSVDEVLLECMRTLQPARRRPSDKTGWLINWVQHVRFSGSRVYNGYDVRDVDAFIDRLVAGLRGTLPALTGRDVREARFRTVRLGPGYSEDEVDRFLDQLADFIERR